jgi:quercetin dioxygenase-like cupin family protein
MPKAAIVRKGEAEALSVMGAEVRFPCTGELTGGAFSLMEGVIPKGSGPPAHFHDWAEAFYVISGEVEFEIDGERLLVKAGDFAYAAGGTVHAFRGASEEPARMLIFDAPAHAEGFFREVDREIRSPQDAAKAPAIGAKHGINFLAPAPV